GDAATRQALGDLPGTSSSRSLPRECAQPHLERRTERRAPLLARDTGLGYRPPSRRASEAGHKPTLPAVTADLTELLARTTPHDRAAQGLDLDPRARPQGRLRPQAHRGRHG